MLKIETSNLVLRDFSASDREAYRNLRNDDKFKRFYADEDVSFGRSDFLLDMFISQSTEQPRTKYQFAIESKDGDLIGSCGIRVESNRQASVGCELGRRWQANGYALEAASAVIEFGFERCGIHRIYAETISENKAALRLCGMLGMRIEAELLENRYFQSRWWNTTVLALLEQEWDCTRGIGNQSTIAI